MITQGPFDLTIGTTLPLSDPGANSNNPATAVQLQNASPFIIEVNSGGTLLTIQAFTAQTVGTSGGGQQMSVTPIASGPTGQTRSAASLSAVWLMAGESSPMIDGTLTASAISTSLAQSGLSGATVIGFSHTLAAGGTITPTLAGASPYRLWNWGFTPAVAGTNPTMGYCTILMGPIGSLTMDTVSVANPASNRLSGMVFDGSNLTIQNGTDAQEEVFIDYSAA